MLKLTDIEDVELQAADGINTEYQGPQGPEAPEYAPCDCNTVTYSMLAACAACQPRADVVT